VTLVFVGSCGNGKERLLCIKKTRRKEEMWWRCFVMEKDIF
jgi:hypothetical protein